jgi:hypothetical protein
MTGDKYLHIVLVYPNPLDIDEAKRIKSAISELTGEDARPICPTGSAMLFLAFAEFRELRSRIEEAKAITTQVLLARVCEPCTTIGFLPAASQLRKHLGHGPG